ncbi:TonB-dependent receptor [bacterium]|nr:TonB-dependent receptor [bacterium]
MKTRFLFICTLIIMMTFIYSAPASAGVTGRLKGKVVDKNSQQPLPDALVKIEGTYFETTPNSSGEFSFIGIDAGTYDVTCSSSSFANHTISETVVFPDQVTELVFELLPSTTGEYPQSTRFQEPYVQSRSPFTINTLTRSEISKLPVRGIDGIILSTTGSIYNRNERSGYAGNYYYGLGIAVNNEGFAEYKEAAVTGSDNLHVRGGADNELGYYLDGMMLNDPFTGNVFAQLPFYAVDHISVQSGGFGASYGSYASAIANITPRRAGNRISVSGQYTTDIAAGFLGANSYGNRLYSLTVSGPVVTKRLKFFAAADLSVTDDAEPSYLGASRYRLTTGGIKNSDPTIMDTVIFKNRRKGPRLFDVNAQSVRNIYASMTFRPTSSIQIDATALHSFKKRNIFFTEYLLAPDRVPHQERSAYNLGLSGKWTVNPDLFVRTSVTYYSTNYQLMERSLFDKGSNGVLLLSERTRGNTNAATYYGDNLLYDINRGFIPYLKSESNNTSLNLGLGWQYEKAHFIEAGIDHRKHTMRYASILDVGHPVGGSNNIYGYEIDTSGSKYRLRPIGPSGMDGAKTPSVTAIYLQDRFDYEIFHFVGGFRYEIFDPGTRVLKNLGNPTGNDGMLNEDDFKAGKSQTYMSPRFGALVEVMPGFSLRGDYGLYYQTANYQQYYVSSDFLERMSIAPPYNTVVGNSSLQPVKNESYELGLNYVYKNIFKLNISRFWKNTLNAIVVVPITSFPNALHSSVNIKEGEIDGWDFQMESRMTQNLQMIFRLGIVENMQDYSVKSSGFRAAWLGYSSVRFQMHPNYWKGSNFSTSIIYQLNKHEGPSIGQMQPFENMTFCIVYTETGGSLYTPTQITKLGVVGVPEPRAVARHNSARIPNRQNLDMKIMKKLAIWQKYQMSGFVLITNVLNAKNAANVFASTGLTNDDAFLATPGVFFAERELNQYYINLKDNFNLEPARQVAVGLTIEF